MSDGQWPGTLADHVRCIHRCAASSKHWHAASRCALVFEDLHWADEALLDLIEFITAHVRETLLLTLTQARPELLEQRPAGAENCATAPRSPWSR